jgi:fatty-acyl-CoA synthase
VFPFFFPDTLPSIKAIEKYKCTSLRGTPTQFIDLINHPERAKHDLSCLKNAIIAGSTVAPDLLIKMKETLKVEDIFIGYGMTETSLCHSLTSFTDKFKEFKYGFESCGRPLPFTETKIVDPNTGKKIKKFVVLTFIKNQNDLLILK